MEPHGNQPVLPPDPAETRLESPAPGAGHDRGRQVLTSLLDMALGSRHARTEAEALQWSFLAENS